MTPLTPAEAFELGFEFHSFVFSSHCYDARDLGRFWCLEAFLWSTPNLAATVKYLGTLYDATGVWNKTKAKGVEVALQVIREHLGK